MAKVTEIGSKRECASEVMQNAPLVIRAIRSGMRKHRQKGLTIGEFRALIFISRNAGCSMTEVAEHVGMTLPSTSKLVDRLVRNGLSDRKTDARDRRNVMLSATKAGMSSLDRTRKGALAEISEKFGAMSEADRLLIVKAMKILRKAFTGSGAAEPAGGGDGNADN